MNIDQKKVVVSVALGMCALLAADFLISKFKGQRSVPFSSGGPIKWSAVARRDPGVETKRAVGGTPQGGEVSREPPTQSAGSEKSSQVFTGIVTTAVQPSPGGTSDQTKKKAEDKIPVFHPGVSQIYSPKEILQRMNGGVVDAWLTGKFIVLKGGPKNKRQCECLEAGERTRRGLNSLLGARENVALPIYCFGWYFHESEFPEFSRVGEDSVLEIFPDAPAKVIKVHMKDGHPTILCMLTRPPKMID